MLQTILSFDLRGEKVCNLGPEREMTRNTEKTASKLMRSENKRDVGEIGTERQ